jgi:hypothetical protein
MPPHAPARRIRPCYTLLKEYAAGSRQPPQEAKIQNKANFLARLTGSSDP